MESLIADESIAYAESVLESGIFQIASNGLKSLGRWKSGNQLLKLYRSDASYFDSLLEDFHMSIELFLKAAWRELFPTEKVKKTHNLKDLADKVGFTCSPTERRRLGRFTEFYYGGGRYEDDIPVADWKEEEIVLQDYFDESTLCEINAFIKRLCLFVLALKRQNKVSSSNTIGRMRLE